MGHSRITSLALRTSHFALPTSHWGVEREGEGGSVISVTRINGEELVINAELIELVESTPDTFITLTTGRKLIVRDAEDEIVSKVIDYRRRISEGT